MGRLEVTSDAEDSLLSSTPKQLGGRLLLNIIFANPSPPPIYTMLNYRPTSQVTVIFWQLVYAFGKILDVCFEIDML